MPCFLHPPLNERLPRYEAAIALFIKALELPGSGGMRVKGQAREIACASEGEENSALYNMACCYAQLGEFDRALKALESCFGNNFTEFDAVRAGNAGPGMLICVLA